MSIASWKSVWARARDGFLYAIYQECKEAYPPCTAPESFHATRSPRLSAGGNRVQIIQSPETHGVTSFAGSAADMRQQESVVEFPVARVDIRFAVEDVETGRRHVARAQRLLQGPSSSMRAPRALLTTIAPPGAASGCARRPGDSGLPGSPGNAGKARRRRPAGSRAAHGRPRPAPPLRERVGDYGSECPCRSRGRVGPSPGRRGPCR